MTRGWPEERRKKQAEMCRRNKPWEKSTGPRTAAGKKKCSRNALKHGGRTQAGKELVMLLRANRAFLEHCENFVVADGFEICETNKLIKHLLKSDG